MRLRSLLERLWPGKTVDPRRVGLSHVYFAGWDKLTPDERKYMFSILRRLDGHIGVSHLVTKYVDVMVTGRKSSKKAPVYTPMDDAIAYIDQMVDEAPQAGRVRLRAALMLMYTCGLSNSQVVGLTGDSFVANADHMVLVTKGYLYVLTPMVRDTVQAWLTICPTPDKPFSRMLRTLAKHRFLSESYDAAQSN